MRSAFVCGVAAATLALASAEESRAINVNFNSCTGATQTGRCGITKLIRYVEGEFPPFDDVKAADDTLEGLAKELFMHICDTSVFKNAGIECVEILDAWSVIWTPDHYPGPAFRSGWYHMAVAFVNSLRKQSHVYSYPISTRPTNRLIVAKTNNKGGLQQTFPDRGQGLRMCVIASWGDKENILKEYNLATPVEVADEKAQISALTMAADGCPESPTEPCCDFFATGSVTAGHLVTPEDSPYRVVGPEEGFKIIDVNDPKHEDSVAFMFSKVDVCLRDLVNEAMAELWSNKKTELQALFEPHSGIIQPKFTTWVAAQ